MFFHAKLFKISVRKEQKSCPIINFAPIKRRMIISIGAKQTKSAKVFWSKAQPKAVAKPGNGIGITPINAPARKKKGAVITFKKKLALDLIKIKTQIKLVNTPPIPAKIIVPITVSANASPIKSVIPSSRSARTPRPLL